MSKQRPFTRCGTQRLASEFGGARSGWALVKHLAAMSAGHVTGAHLRNGLYRDQRIGWSLSVCSETECMNTLPSQMRAVVLGQYQEDVADAIDGLKVVEKPVPSLRRGQVLVRIEAAPCNPSDLLLLQGKYGVLKTLPCVPGWEGAGTVVASGGGWLAGWLKGKRVACGGQDDRDGTWAEFFVADANACIPLKRRVIHRAGREHDRQSADGDGALGHGPACGPSRRCPHRRGEPTRADVAGDGG